MASAKPSIKDILIRAEQAEKNGDTAQAVAIYGNILAKFPKHARAKKALKRLQKTGAGGGGNRMTQSDAQMLGDLLNTGQFAQVLTQVNLLLVHNRKEAFLYNVQGLAQTNLGQNKQAITSFKHAIKLNPNFIEAYNSLGLGLIKDERAEEALVPLQKALEKRENYPEAHHNLGVALAALGREEEALTSYNHSLSLRINYANAYNSRGALHSAMGNYELAIEDYNKALALVPDDAEVCNNLSTAYTETGDSQKAAYYIEKALALFPDNVDFLHAYAVLLNGLERNDEARTQLNKILTLEPSHAMGLMMLASIDGNKVDPTLLQQMKSQFTNKNVAKIDKVKLGFALAKISEGVGDFSQELAYLKIANETNFNLLEYDIAQENANFAEKKKAYNPKAIARLNGLGNPTDVPILIVGMMRSGTSLVEQILASHSQVWGAGELMAATRRAKGLDIHQKLPTANQLSEFSNLYIDDLTLNVDGMTRATDKMPGNFAHIGLMKLAFPNIKIVNMVRDPRDTCYSIYKNYFDTQAHQYAYNLEAMANFANQYKSLMAHWHSVFPGQIYDCCYEDLTENQEDESRKLLAYCDLEWEPQVLDFHKNKRAVRTASVNQVRRKIYQTSVRSWERVAEGLVPMINGLDTELWSQYLK